MSLKRASAVAASAVLLGTLATVPASTALAAPAAACTMTVGSITSGGDIGAWTITASSPVTAQPSTGVHVFTPGIAKLSSTWTSRNQSNGYKLTSGEVLLNDSIYSAWYGTDPDGKLVVGMGNGQKGFGQYLVTESSTYRQGGSLDATYRLRGDGVLYRWAHRWDGNPTSVVTRFTGYSAVKTMALISETATYDTFLANTHGGALYTIRILRTTEAVAPLFGE